MSKWILREPKKTDIPFIYQTWLNSFRYDSWSKATAKSVFFDHYKLVIDEILSNSKTLIACLPEDEDIILGYLVYESQIIHYIFVKNDFRKYGIAANLVNHSMDLEQPITITHRTKTALPILNNKNWIFNPFKLYKGV